MCVRLIFGCRIESGVKPPHSKFKPVANLRYKRCLTVSGFEVENLETCRSGEALQVFIGELEEDHPIFLNHRVLSGADEVAEIAVHELA